MPTPTTYVVRRGDSLDRIARAHNVDFAELIRENPQLSNPDLIHPGDVVRIPERKLTTAPAPRPAAAGPQPVAPGPRAATTTPAVQQRQQPPARPATVTGPTPTFTRAPAWPLSDADRAELERLRPRLALDTSRYDALINEAAATYNVEPALVKAVIAAESSFNRHIQSSAGATGLAQLMPATAREMGVTDPTNARQSIFGCARYIRHMINEYGYVDDRLIAAYNAGPDAVRQAGGVPRFRETERFLSRVLLVRSYYLNESPLPPLRPDERLAVNDRAAAR